MSQRKSALLPFGLFVLFISLFSVEALAQSKGGWVEKSDKDAVKVFFRKSSDIYELKLVTSIQVPMSGIVQLFDEVKDYPKWAYKVSEARLLKRVSPTEMYYYTKVDFPWPMSDRDLVLHTELKQNAHNNSIVSTSTAIKGWVPEKKDVVRMPTAQTKWKLTPGKGGWIYIEYYLYSDPGGNIPDWAINLALEVGPRETVKRMREILRGPEYQNTKLAHIRE